MPRVLLLLPTTTYRSHDFLEAARRLDVEVTVASEEPSAVEGLNPAGLLTMDFRDAEACARIARSFAQTRGKLSDTLRIVAPKSFGTMNLAEYYGIDKVLEHERDRRLGYALLEELVVDPTTGSLAAADSCNAVRDRVAGAGAAGHIQVT